MLIKVTYYPLFASRPEEMRFFKEAVFKYALYEPGLLEPEGNI